MMDWLSFVRVPINKQEFPSCRFSPTASPFCSTAVVPGCLLQGTGSPVRHEAPLGLSCHQGSVTEQREDGEDSMWSQAWHWGLPGVFPVFMLKNRAEAELQNTTPSQSLPTLAGS